MKTTLNIQEKKDATDLLSFIRGLDESEKNDFSVFIKGFELGKQFATKQAGMHKMN